MLDHAKISGYTPEAVAKIAKAFDSRPGKNSWRKHKKIEELECYQCEITRLSKNHAVYCISNMRNINGNISRKQVSVVNTELSLKV